jgi:hypothetical protein
MRQNLPRIVTRSEHGLQNGGELLLFLYSSDKAACKIN